MKTLMSTLVALAVLTVAAAPASATFKPGNTKEVFKEIERNLP